MRNRWALFTFISVGVLSVIGCGDTTGTGGTGGSSSNGGEAEGGAAAGGAPATLNGCTTAADADDMTGMPTVDMDWSLPHQSCIRVDVGTVVNWNVDPATFTTHPLEGGEPPTIDDASPITQSDQTTTTASVTFTDAGEYPYFCGVHFASMQGVVFVE